MPKREDEFWAGMKEGKGRALCPFCGGSTVYYNKRYGSWRCGACEKSFPSPSYGPGGRVKLLICPKCREKSLFWNESTDLYECLNHKCKRRFTKDELRRKVEITSKGVGETRIYRPSKGDEDYPFDPDHVGYYKGEYSTRVTGRRNLSTEGISLKEVLRRLKLTLILCVVGGALMAGGYAFALSSSVEKVHLIIFPYFLPIPNIPAPIVGWPMLIFGALLFIGGIVALFSPAD